MFQLTDHEQFLCDFVATHNHYRRRHGASELTLSGELTQKAQAWAETLAQQRRHLAYCELPGIGESATFFPQDMAAAECVSWWYEEGAHYDHNAPGWQLNTNYFTQLVWRDTRELGVGRALLSVRRQRHPKTGQLIDDSLNNHQAIVAFYSPAGNSNRAGQFATNVLPPISAEADALDAYGQVEADTRTLDEYSPLNDNADTAAAEMAAAAVAIAVAEAAANNCLLNHS